MEVVALVLPLALIMGGSAVWVFIRCVRSGQYDDLDTPPLRVLSDDFDANDSSAAIKPRPNPRGSQTASAPRESRSPVS